MKKTLVVAALTGVFATAANAQSSVTLYGLIDTGILYTNNVSTTPSGANGGSRWAQTSGNINGSRWGLRGAEDLGGGLKAIFQLENGFSINNGSLGQGTREFGRQAFVGLSSNQYGSLTIGRQYTTNEDLVGPLSLTGTGYGGTISAHPLDNDNLDDSVRLNNGVKYSSVSYGGFKFEGMYNFSNQANGFANNRAYGGAVAYNWNGFYFAGGYLQVTNGGAFTTNGGGGLANNGLGAYTGDSNFQAFQSMRVYDAGVNYAFGPAVVGFVFSQAQYQNATAPAGLGGAGGQYFRFNNYEVNGRYSLTPAWNVSASYTYTQARDTTATNAASPKFHTATLMTSYSLSKRTDLYAQAVYERVVDGDGSTLGHALITGGGGSSTTDKQVAAVVGIRHRF